MPNHLTPAEISREFGLKREEVLRICVEENVPVYNGRIDKTLFHAVRDELERGVFQTAS